MTLLQMAFSVVLGPRQSRGLRRKVLLSPSLPSGTRPREKGMWKMLSPSRTLLPKESNIQREEVAPSSSKTPTGDTSTRESIKVPKNPSDDFAVPPARTPYGNGFFNPSRSFPWIADLGPMLDEIWSEESFKRLSEEPL